MPRKSEGVPRGKDSRMRITVDLDEETAEDLNQILDGVKARGCSPSISMVVRVAIKHLRTQKAYDLVEWDGAFKR